MKSKAILTRALTTALVLAMALSLVTSVQAAKEKSITILLETVPDSEYVIRLIPEFEKATGIKVNVEKTTFMVMRDKLMTNVLSGRGQYDVIVVDAPFWTGQFVNGRWIIPLDDYIKETPSVNMDVYYPSMLDLAGVFDGVTYMLPFYQYNMVMLTRSDIVDDPKIRKEYKAKFGRELDFNNLSVEEYVQVAKFLTRDTNGDGKVDIWGSIMTPKKSDTYCDWANYFFGLGGDFYTNKKVTINSQAGVKALNLYMDALKNAAPAGSMGFSFDDALNAMAQGQGATMVTFNWMLGPLNDPAKSKVAGKLNVHPVPGGRGVSAGWGWAIPWNAPDKDAAWQFISWVESAKIARQRALMGGAPTRRDILEDPELSRKFAAYYSTLKKVLPTAVPAIPMMLEQIRFEDIVNDYLGAALLGEMSAEDALNRAAKELSRLR